MKISFHFKSYKRSDDLQLYTPSLTVLFDDFEDACILNFAIWFLWFSFLMSIYKEKEL